MAVIPRILTMIPGFGQSEVTQSIAALPVITLSLNPSVRRSHATSCRAALQRVVAASDALKLITFLENGGRGGKIISDEIVIWGLYWVMGLIWGLYIITHHLGVVISMVVWCEKSSKNICVLRGLVIWS